MSEPIYLRNKAGKTQVLNSPSEAARMVSGGEWAYDGGPGTQAIPGEENVHVEADTTDPQPFSAGLPEAKEYTHNQKPKQAR